MKTNHIKIISLLCVSLLFTVSLTACASKDKETILSKNVSQGVKDEENQIQKNIELGNKYLEENKYDDAKKAYEKAISMNINNKQTYLQIKDKYLGKNRIDDAYYIIKLAMDNKVDVSNMKVVLEEIIKKFDVTTIKKSVCQNDPFELPKQVTVKINNEDTQADVKWNSSTMDTSRIGDFILEGTAVKYERPVKMMLKVNAGISDEQVVNLLDNGYNISTKLCDEFIYNSNAPTVLIPNYPDFDYKKLPDEYNSEESIYKYFLEKYEVNKYFTDYYVKYIINYKFQEYNGKYYTKIGNIGISPIIKQSKIISKKYDENTVNVVYIPGSTDNQKWNELKATLVYTNGKWLIDKADYIFPME